MEAEGEAQASSSPRSQEVAEVNKADEPNDSYEQNGPYESSESSESNVRSESAELSEPSEPSPASISTSTRSSDDYVPVLHKANDPFDEGPTQDTRPPQRKPVLTPPAPPLRIPSPRSSSTEEDSENVFIVPIINTADPSPMLNPPRNREVRRKRGFFSFFSCCSGDAVDVTEERPSLPSPSPRGVALPTQTSSPRNPPQAVNAPVIPPSPLLDSSPVLQSPTLMETMESSSVRLNYGDAPEMDSQRDEKGKAKRSSRVEEDAVVFHPSVPSEPGDIQQTFPVEERWVDASGERNRLPEEQEEWKEASTAYSESYSPEAARADSEAKSRGETGTSPVLLHDVEEIYEEGNNSNSPTASHEAEMNSQEKIDASSTEGSTSVRAFFNLHGSTDPTEQMGAPEALKQPSGFARYTEEEEKQASPAPHDPRAGRSAYPMPFEEPLPPPEPVSEVCEEKAAAAAAAEEEVVDPPSILRPSSSAGRSIERRAEERRQSMRVSVVDFVIPDSLPTADNSPITRPPVSGSDFSPWSPPLLKKYPDIQSIEREDENEKPEEEASEVVCEEAAEEPLCMPTEVVSTPNFPAAPKEEVNPVTANQSPPTDRDPRRSPSSCSDGKRERDASTEASSEQQPSVIEGPTEAVAAEGEAPEPIPIEKGITMPQEGAQEPLPEPKGNPSAEIFDEGYKNRRSSDNLRKRQQSVYSMHSGGSPSRESSVLLTGVVYAVPPDSSWSSSTPSLVSRKMGDRRSASARSVREITHSIHAAPIEHQMHEWSVRDEASESPHDVPLIPEKPRVTKSTSARVANLPPSSLLFAQSTALEARRNEPYSILDNEISAPLLVAAYREPYAPPKRWPPANSFFSLSSNAPYAEADTTRLSRYSGPPYGSYTAAREADITYLHDFSPNR